jgi:putative ABC transport system permease protein
VRGFRREPGVALIAIAILALGIGANTAVFSIVNPLLLRPLPFPDADRLVWIANSGTTGLSGRTFRVDWFEELRGKNRSFEEMGAYFAFFGYGGHTLTGRGEPERLVAVDISPQFFDVLGVKPAIGRMFTANEHKRAGPRAVLLGHGLWQRRFAGDPAVVGTAVTINNVAVTIAGVMPATFDFRPSSRRGRTWTHSFPRTSTRRAHGATRSRWSAASSPASRWQRRGRSSPRWYRSCCKRVPICGASAS